MLNLAAFFDSIQSENYCIIKINNKFPNYSSGEDVDIFCYNQEKITQRILEWGNEYVRQGLEIKVATKSGDNHIYVDFLENNDIHFRFDLYGKLPQYKDLLIKPALFESIIEHSQTIIRQFEGQEYSLKVPCEIDDMILRYIEFIEWYNVKPDKIKHIDYILDKIDSDKKIQFLDKLHHYTQLPECYNNEKKIKRDYLAVRIYNKFKGKSLIEIGVAALRKLMSVGKRICRLVFRV